MNYRLQFWFYSAAGTLLAAFQRPRTIPLLFLHAIGIRRWHLHDMDEV